VVPRDSAILPGYIPIGIRDNHIDMTKFDDMSDPGFIAVCGELRRWIKDLRMHGEQHSIHEQQQKGMPLAGFEVGNESLNVLRWLSQFQQENKHYDVQSKRAPRTGMWLLQTAQFIDWSQKEDSNCYLWCYGGPGSGKTVLTYVQNHVHISCS
jgi:hypothetical protein